MTDELNGNVEIDFKGDHIHDMENNQCKSCKASLAGICQFHVNPDSVRGKPK